MIDWTERRLHRAYRAARIAGRDTSGIEAALDRLHPPLPPMPPDLSAVLASYTLDARRGRAEEAAPWGVRLALVTA